MIFSLPVCLFMDYSSQANGSFAVSLLYNGRGVFSTPRHYIFGKYFSCSWLCRLIFHQPQYFIVHCFAACLTEMDGHSVIGRADTLCKYARFSDWLCFSNGICLGSTIHVIGNNHPFCGACCPVDFESHCRGLWLRFVFPAFIPATFLRPALFDIRRVFSIAVLCVTPRRVPCKGYGSRYLTGCGIRF